MAEHEVKFTIPYRDLGKSDVEFKVKQNSETFGELKISKGSLVWFPKDTQIGHRATWAQFNKFMRKMKKLEKR